MISTTLSPCPSIPAPGWTPTNKELGRVDSILALEDGRTFIGGNFSTLTVDGGTALQRPYLAEVKGGSVGALVGRTTGRVYDILWRKKDSTLHVVGHGGYDVYQGGTWHNVLTNPLRSIAVKGGKFYLGEESGYCRQLDGWRVSCGGSARTVLATSDAIYVGTYDTQKKGTFTKLDPATGKKLVWADATAIGPVLDLALSPDKATLYAAIGGPGGTAAAYDVKTGKRKWFYTTDGNCQAICTLDDGTVVVGMHGDNVAPDVNQTMAEYGSSKRIPRKKVFALGPDGKLSNWHVDLSSNQGVLGLWALDASSSMLYCGGDFTSVNGKEHPRLAAFAVS